MNWKEENIDDTIKEMGNLVTLIYDYAKHWRLDNFNNINAFLRDNVDNEELSPRERNTILTLSTNYPDGQVLRFFTNRADLQCVIGKNPHKKRFTLIFRGSEGFWDWIYDMCVFKVKLGDYGMKVHSGFYNQLMYNHTFDEIRQYIINYTNDYQYRDWEWVVSGHSLGGALSVLAGYLLSSHITYFKWILKHHLHYYLNVVYVWTVNQLTLLIFYHVYILFVQNAMINLLKMNVLFVEV